MMISNPPIHVVMRYSDGLVKDTIRAHNEVIAKHNAVWLGKMGKTLGANRIVTMDQQRKEHIPTYLYLVQRVGTRYDVFKGTTLEIRKGLPERALVPKYYFAKEMFRFIALWIKLSKIEQMDTSVLSDLLVQSSGMPMESTLRKSMAAMFIVRNRI